MQNSINIHHQCLKLKANGIIRYAKLSEIVYLKGDDNYTSCVMNDLSEYSICQTLHSYEMILGAYFLRCHKSFLVNSIYIREINKREHQVILTTGLKLPCSRMGIKILERKMETTTLIDQL